jgi:hypothetical protein
MKNMQWVWRERSLVMPTRIILAKKWGWKSVYDEKDEKMEYGEQISIPFVERTR